MNIAEEKTKNLKRAPMLNRESVLQDDKKYWAWKRAQDIILALLGLIVLWPLMLIVAIAIVIDSPGAGPIFSQIRIGRDGKEFTFYKFRSMKPNAEEELNKLLPYNEMEGPAFKIRKDPRITKVGRFIRKASIDELPQLWNVLRGDMSIVGPRPGLPREVAQYDDYAKQRLFITPGLTCFWQIQPDRNSLSFDEWLELDIQYIRQRSFWVDWKIIFKTFGTILDMDGI